MSSLDSQQVQLRLTTVPYVLQELKKKRRLRQDSDPDNKVGIFDIQFDSKTFSFKPGRTITVGKSVADCLQQDAFVIVGAAIDGEVNPVLEIVKEYNLSEGESSATPTTCLFCKEDMGTPRALAEHLLADHDDEEGDSSASHPPARKSKKSADKDMKDDPNKDE